MKTLPAEQLAAFLAEAKETGTYEMYYLDLATGMRRGELLGLKWEDIDFDHGIIHIRRQVARLNGTVQEAPLKTKNSYRNISIGDDAVELLKKKREQDNGKSVYVFPSPTGGPLAPDSVLHMLNRVLERAGLPKIRFHDLRHTFATLALQNGVDIKPVSGMLGHFSAGFTLDTYAHVTTPGNIADSSVAAEILAAADQTVSLKECTFLADKGYDVKSIYNTVKTVYEGEAFIPLNPRGTRALKTLPAGNPVCEAGFAMHKDGKTTDNGRTRQKYCCSFRQSKASVCPCNHKNWNNGRKNRGCTKYKTVPDDYRLSIDRSCLCFKRTYALRTECERYNSRFKSTGQERLWVRNGASAANLNTLAHISALAVALAAVLHGSHSYRSAKQLRRSA